MDRYRKALETAVQISCRYNVPPLPGRTVILISTNMSFNQTLKQDFCLPPDPEQNNDVEEEESEDSRGRGSNKKEDDNLNPTVRACFVLISNNTKGIWAIWLS